jgi:hypothetical protein
MVLDALGCALFPGDGPVVEDGDFFHGMVEAVADVADAESGFPRDAGVGKVGVKFELEKLAINGGKLIHAKTDKEKDFIVLKPGGITLPVRVRQLAQGGIVELGNTGMLAVVIAGEVADCGEEPGPGLGDGGAVVEEPEKRVLDDVLGGGKVSGKLHGETQKMSLLGKEEGFNGQRPGRGVVVSHVSRESLARL